ncbi:M56 family metallopeptidase [Streptomyces sp. b94]|uniref:M56 family metallopeptidase n=1 Tax=Streptomyces sp. b94 TaxID=1827634 RepID=UPI001B37CEE3|nr:M56 family metallopeptidase [Streptomyces sp. b94]MBQ1098263.1 M56 family metallopeptidase [Streptomyces sp. b94]
MLLSVLLLAVVSAAVTHTRWPYRTPCAALVLWLAACLGALSGLLMATYGLVVHFEGIAEHETLRIPFDLTAVVLAWMFVARVIRAYARLHRQSSMRRERHLTLLSLFGRADEQIPAVILPIRQPLAYSVPGPDGGHAVLSDVVLAEFSVEEVDSVLAHEQAHLRQRHHLLTQFADAFCAALPKRRFAVRFAERFHGLIEMRADCAARVQCGRHVTASALARMAYDKSLEPDIASDCPVAARRRHLLFNERCCNSLAASAAFCMACAVAVAPAVLTALGVLAAACTWICR